MRSDLRILVVGFVNKYYSDVFSTLNALVGRLTFSRDRESEKQEACVEVDGGRRLWLTYMTDTLFRDMGDAYSEGRTTELDSTMYHCVVIAMVFNESTLSLWHSGVVSETLSQKFGESFLRKHCVIVVGGGDGFAKARSEGRETRTFEGRCKAFVARDGDNCFAVFKGVQERWLLFNNNGSPDELKHQRRQLVDLIDTQILVASHYTDMKLKEVDKSLRELEKQHLELKGQLEMETKKHLDTRESDILKHQIIHVKQDTSKLSEKLELQMSELKQQRLEKTESDKRDLKHQITQVKQDTSKLLEKLDQKLAMLNKGLSQEIEERNADLKERLEEKRESDTQDLKHQIKQVNKESWKRSETLQQQLYDLNVKHEEKLSELEKRYKSQLQKATERSQEFEHKVQKATERSQELEHKVQMATERSQEMDHKVQKATERSQELEDQVTELKHQLQDNTKYREELHRFYSGKETERSQALERQVAFLGLLRKQLQDKTTKLEEQQTFFSSHAMKRTKALEQQLTETKEQLEEKTTKLEEQQTSFSDEATERTKTLEQKTTELGKRISSHGRNTVVSQKRKLFRRKKKLNIFSIYGRMFSKIVTNNFDMPLYTPALN